MSHILIVEDDRDIADLIRHYVVRAGHTAEVLSSGSDVLPAIRARRPEVLVLDLMLPGLHGLEVCQAIRRDPTLSDLPVIVVTARADESDRVAGLDLGADDYVTKPFSPKELVARVGALLRRAGRGRTSGGGLTTYEGIAIDRDRHVVTDNGREVVLTAKEFLLLEYFMQHRGRVVSRDRLLSEVWDYQYTGGTRTVDVHVRRLREKIPRLADALVTVKQFGYKLSESPTDTPDR